MKFRILEYKPAAAGRRIGVVDVIFDDELIIRGIAIVAGKDGGPPMALLPSKQWKKRDGTVMYDRLVQFKDRELGEAFQSALLAQLREKHNLAA